MTPVESPNLRYSMVVCRYFIQGRCKKGVNCEFEHPVEKSLSNTKLISTVDTDNRFVQKNSRNHSSLSAGSGGTHTSEIKPEDVIENDLRNINLEWPLSCYGINLSWESGDNIIHGDYSPEELRLEAYAQIKTSNNILKYIEAVNNVSLQQKIKIENVLSNISGAVLRAKTPRSLRIELESRVTTPSSVKPTSNSTCPKISTSNTNVPFSTVGEFTFGEIPEIPPS